MIWNMPALWPVKSQGFEFPFSNESLTEPLLEFVEEDK